MDLGGDNICNLISSLRDSKESTTLMMIMLLLPTATRTLTSWCWGLMVFWVRFVLEWEAYFVGPTFMILLTGPPFSQCCKFCRLQLLLQRMIGMLTDQYHDSRETIINHNPCSKKFGLSRCLIDSILETKLQDQSLAGHQIMKIGDLKYWQWHSDSMWNWMQVGWQMHWMCSPMGMSTKLSGKGKLDGQYWWLGEDLVTVYSIHNKGWKCVYFVSKLDQSQRSTSQCPPIGHCLCRHITMPFRHVLGWVFFQKVTNLNIGIQPFISIFLIVYCFLPAFSVFTGQFIMKTIFNEIFFAYLVVITTTHILCYFYWDWVVRNHSTRVVEGWAVLVYRWHKFSCCSRAPRHIDYRNW